MALSVSFRAKWQPVPVSKKLLRNTNSRLKRAGVCAYLALCKIAYLRERTKKRKRYSQGD